MAKETTYINNPLKIGVDGSKLLFQKAPMAALILAVLSALNASSYFAEPASPPAAEGAAVPTDAAFEVAAAAIVIFLIVVLAFGFLLLGSFIAGIFAYTSAEIAKGREVTFRQAVKATAERFWSFVWLQVLTTLKVLAWALLFIVPGIVMAIRYSLANLSFFDDKKKLTGNAAIKDSLTLTKGAWVTTFAGQMFLSIITLGTIGFIVDTGSKAVLYRQLSAIESGTPKPKPHALSWVTLGFTILITVLFVVFLGNAIVNYGLTTLGA